MGCVIHEPADGVYGLRFDIPYNVQAVDIYLLDGSPRTLIDTGPIMPGVEEEVSRGLADLGFTFASIERIIITHHHPDHMGLAARFKEAGGAQVVCHRAGEAMVSDYAGQSRRLIDYLVGLSDYLGLDSELVRASIMKTEQWFDVAEPVEVDSLVEDGSLLEGKPYPLHVIHTPGHSIDHICLYLPEKALLFTGDMLMRTITPNPDIYPPWQSDERSGLPGYLRSLARLRELPALRAFPGHGQDVGNSHARIDEVLEHHRERLEFIRRRLEGQEATVLEMALQLLEFIGAEPNVENIFLAMREVFGHLVIMEERGSAFVTMRGKTAFYGAV